jgi:hypothetical protein
MANTTITIGPGFVGLLTLIFVVAKLWGKIDWSWWWVFSPLWISGLLILAILIVALIIIITLVIIKAITD